jgi:hypothetical protein
VSDQIILNLIKYIEKLLLFTIHKRYITGLVMGIFKINICKYIGVGTVF